MKRTPEQEAARKARRSASLNMVKCACGNTARLGTTQCSRCSEQSSTPNPLEIATAGLEYVRACFAAAECEGLFEALKETTDERLKDIVERRLLPAYYGVQDIKEES